MNFFSQKKYDKISQNVKSQNIFDRERASSPINLDIQIAHSPIDSISTPRLSPYNEKGISVPFQSPEGNQLKGILKNSPRLRAINWSDKNSVPVNSLSPLPQVQSESALPTNSLNKTARSFYNFTPPTAGIYKPAILPSNK